MASDKSRELGTLVVVVLKARNLRDKHTFSKQDPYTTIKLGVAQKSTQVDKRGGQHPVWDEELHIPVLSEGSQDNRTLKALCFSEESKNDDLIGEGSVDITETLRTGEFDDWVKLEENGAYRGEVFLEMTFFAAGPAPAKLDRRPSKWVPAERLSRPPSALAPGQRPPASLAPERRRPINASLPPATLRPGSPPRFSPPTPTSFSQPRFPARLEAGNFESPRPPTSLMPGSPPRSPRLSPTYNAPTFPSSPPRSPRPLNTYATQPAPPGQHNNAITKPRLTPSPKDLPLSLLPNADVPSALRPHNSRAPRLPAQPPNFPEPLHEQHLPALPDPYAEARYRTPLPLPADAMPPKQPFLPEQPSLPDPYAPRARKEERLRAEQSREGERQRAEIGRAGQELADEELARSIAQNEGIDLERLRLEEEDEEMARRLERELNGDDPGQRVVEGGGAGVGAMMPGGW